MSLSEGKINWYVLYARTGSELRVVERLKSTLDSSQYLPFIPRKTCVFRRQGKKSVFQKNCFPGYVFIESNRSMAEFIEHVYPIIYKLKDAYRFLNYGDKSNIAMKDEERIALSKIIGIDHCIDISIGLKVGDSVKVLSGVLSGNESKIVQVNKGKHEAIISIQMFGNMVPVSVGLEIIDKVPEMLLY